MRMPLTLYLFFCIIVTNAVLSGGPAYAAGGGEHPVLPWSEMLWPVINFAIIAGVLYYFGRKPVREFLKKRTEMIETSLKNSAEAKESARRALEEVKERLANTDREIGEILEAAKRAGERERDAIIAEGQELKNKLLEQARRNIAFQIQKAKEEIKSEASLTALELAEKQIREKLDRDQQHTLIDENLKKLDLTRKTGEEIG